MCTAGRTPKVKSLNDESVKTYSEMKSQGLGLDKLPKGGATAKGKKKEEYNNAVSRRILSAKNIRGGRTGLRIPTSNIQSGSGLQI